jgi:enterochelin esterase-like enzyme
VPASPVTGPWTGDGTVIFRVADADRALAGVRLLQDARIPADQLDFGRTASGWELTVARPAAARMEYLLELRYPGGGTKVSTDPANPRQVPGAFGPKSVLEFPGYVPPAWLSAPATRGNSLTFELPVLDDVMSVRVWSPPGAPDAEPLPLLVVHDGPEYDSLASLTRYLGAGIRGRWLPLLRAALLSPGPRNSWYSANARYARALRQTVLTALDGRIGVSGRIGMGTSLGGLAMLHAYCRYPDSFDALFLQSGSFFTPALDSQERRFPYYRRIVGFTADVHGGGLPARPVRVVMTCGEHEENAANNRFMAQTLRAHDYPVALHEIADMHNYTAWRDALDPPLTGLLQQAPLLRAGHTP